MKMNKSLVLIAGAGLSMVLGGAFLFSSGRAKAAADPLAPSLLSEFQKPGRHIINNSEFEVQVVVGGQALESYEARGRTYVEAIEGSEYELRVRNPFPFRVAVALSVDGLNTIDAQHTSAWEASKWIIGPYQTIDISGWQVSSARARHFYFTTERESYGAKLGQTTNLGVISAVFFRERQPIPVQVAPPPEPRPVRPYEEDSSRESRGSDVPSASVRKESKAPSYPAADDESAATGIGRSVTNDVRWVNMQLEQRILFLN